MLWCKMQDSKIKTSGVVKVNVQKEERKRNKYNLVFTIVNAACKRRKIDPEDDMTIDKPKQNYEEIILRSDAIS